MAPVLPAAGTALTGLLAVRLETFQWETFRAELQRNGYQMPTRNRR